MQLVRAGAEAPQIQSIASSFRGSVKRLSGSAGLCVCRPCSACYFLEVIRPTLPHQGKALMISGSHEICTACRSCLLCFTELRFASSSPPSLFITDPSYYLFLSPLLTSSSLFFLSVFSSVSRFLKKPSRPSLSITLISLFLATFLCSLSLSSTLSLFSSTVTISLHSMHCTCVWEKDRNELRDLKNKQIHMTLKKKATKTTHFLKHMKTTKTRTIFPNTSSKSFILGMPVFPGKQERNLAHGKHCEKHFSIIFLFRCISLFSHIAHTTVAWITLLNHCWHRKHESS